MIHYRLVEIREEKKDYAKAIRRLEEHRAKPKKTET
jgi:hypothetical protein